ncbi:MAG: tRNA adenosine(34) deaminase TadA [Legionellaceae bacterium]|nr:tRNA adenosine(34) deaminase TadA [Legionellaceae bacterium]
MHDSQWMQEAMFLAQKSFDNGEVPVGAVVVSSEGKLIGSGCNQMISQSDPVAHAEILAIKEACLRDKNYRLDGATLYVTLEPCCMCAGAMVHARLKRVVFATRDFKAGAAGSVYNLLQGYPLNHQVEIDEGPFQKESARLLADFFQIRRSHNS